MKRAEPEKQAGDEAVPPDCVPSVEEIFQSVDNAGGYWHDLDIGDLHVTPKTAVKRGLPRNVLIAENNEDTIEVDRCRHATFEWQTVKSVNLNSIPSEKAKMPGRIFETGSDTDFRAVLMTVDLKRPVRWFFEKEVLKNYRRCLNTGVNAMISVARSVHQISDEENGWRWMWYQKYADM